MIKLNNLQYNPIKLDFSEDQNYSLDSLVGNFDSDDLCKKYKEKFGFSEIKTFSFSKEGFLGLFLELKGKIAVSSGECEALIQGAELYKSLGFELTWIGLNKDESVNYQELEGRDIDFLFLSSYVMNTFFEASLVNVKNFTNAKIVSNGSAKTDSLSDIVYFDNYKLCGYSLSGVILFSDENIFELLNVAFIDTLAVKCCFEALENQKFNYEVKEKLLEKLKEKLKDNIYFFIGSKKTLPYTPHFALKDIKARETIRALAFDSIFLSNGEGCSLGLSEPSKTIQAMGHDETTSRNVISLDFLQDFDEETILRIVDKIERKYKQTRVLE